MESTHACDHGSRITLLMGVAALLICSVALSSTVNPGSGWHARYEGTLGKTTTHAPSASFALESGTAIHPELRARGWTAAYTGRVTLTEAGTYRFGVEVEGGEATLECLDTNGKELSVCRASSGEMAMTAWLALPAGEVDIKVTCKRAARGDGRLRTLWEMQPSDTGGFRAEPIPSSVVRIPDALMDEASSGVNARSGRVLLERKGCTNCHQTDAMSETAVITVPAPNLNRLGDRASAEWIRRWLNDPSKIKPGTDMPHLLGDDEFKHALAEDLTQFLLSDQQTTAADNAPPSDAQVEEGRLLYHTVGCVACHGPLVTAREIFNDPLLPDELPDARSLAPLGDLSGKWYRPALARFLQDPLSIRPGGRMPSLNLTEAEAEAIASYLTTHFGAAPDNTITLDPEKVTQGQGLFEKFSCRACHEREGTSAAATKTPLADLNQDSGCLDTAAGRRLGISHYDLSADELHLLKGGIASANRGAGISAPIDAGMRTYERLRCTACHQKDGVHGPGDLLRPFFYALDDRVDLGDEGRMPPDLSGVGFKLTSPWLKEVLTNAGQARPYIATRMPQFGTDNVAHLAHAFAAEEGVFMNADLVVPASTDDAVLAGRQLVGTDGMSCMTCHSFTDLPPAGSPGPDITDFSERLRYEWWRAYIQAPARYKPGTRMPAFALGRKSTVENVLDGDIYRQADAMWSYFSLGEGMPPPPGTDRRGGFRIEVGDRPVVLRTFLENAGSRGIAIGFPAGMHLSFDAAGCRLVEMWQGDFLDASGIWAGRGGQNVGGKGPGVWSGPSGAPFSIGEKPATWPVETGNSAGYSFRGYRLDRQGTPTLLYEIGDVAVAERNEPLVIPQTRLIRTFELNGLQKTAWLNAGSSPSRVERNIGCEVVSHNENGEHWFEIRPDGSGDPVSLTLEVTP